LRQRARGCYRGAVAVNVYHAVKQAMQDLVAPQIESLRSDITTVAASVNALRADVQGDIASLRGEIQGLRGELNGLRAETAANIARLDERLTVALDVRERLVALETRLAVR
jgi:hypothetical protein